MLSDHDQAVDRLKQLAVELESRSFAVRLLTRPDQPPCLRVINPAAPVLSEHVLVAPNSDGEWWFCFPWPQRIAVTDDVTAAADRIEHVLAEVDR